MPDDGEADAGAGHAVFTVVFQVVDGWVITSRNQGGPRDGDRQPSLDRFCANVERGAVRNFDRSGKREVDGAAETVRVTVHERKFRGDRFGKLNVSSVRVGGGVEGVPVLGDLLLRLRGP